MLLAALVLFATAACGVQSNTGSGSSETGGTPLAQAVAPEQETINFGGQYRFDDGLTVAVSKPTSFQPSASAYPRSDRAAAFDIRNDGDQPYRLSALSVTATIADVVAKQVVDTTQGYTGIADAGKDVQPGRDVQVTLAFAVSPEPASLRVSIKPTATSSVVAVYCGSA